MTTFGICSQDGCCLTARHVTVDATGTMNAWCYEHQALAVIGGPVAPVYTVPRLGRPARGAGTVSSTLEVITWVGCIVLALSAMACLLALGLTAAGIEARWGDGAVLALAVSGSVTGLAWVAQQAIERAVLARALGGD